MRLDAHRLSCPPTFERPTQAKCLGGPPSAFNHFQLLPRDQGILGSGFRASRVAIRAQQGESAVYFRLFTSAV